MDTDILKTMVELVNDSVTALLALTDGVDYAQNHGHDMWAIARVTIFLTIFLSSNFLIRKAWKEREKWKDELQTAEANKAQPPVYGRFIYNPDHAKVYQVIGKREKHE